MRAVIVGAFVGFVGMLAASDGRAQTSPSSGSSGAPVRDEVDTEIEVTIKRVVSLSQFPGTALRTAIDPRFVVVGRVSWVQKPAVLPLHSEQAFAIHSPTQLGLNGWTAGSTICWLLTRTRRDGETQWRLTALKPDAGCQTRGLARGDRAETEQKGRGQAR